MVSAAKVTVIGGGLAGITAALDCARGGAEVTLLGSRGRLGGAVYSFTRDGLLVDNGQHVFLRCCTAYRDLLERCDATDMVTVQPRLRIPVLAPGGRRAILERTSAPAPLHLTGALARYRLLPRSDRLAVARAMIALRRIDPGDPAAEHRSFGHWLADQGQTPAAIAALWELIGRPTLNLRAQQASLAQAAQVFRLGLLTECTAGDIGWARVPLSEIHDVAARRALASAGVEVHLRRGVSSVTRDGHAFRIEISGAPTERSDVVILATPPDRTAQLLPSGTGIEVNRLLGLGKSPIVNLHVGYDRCVLDEPLAAAVDSPVQWIFDRTRSSGAAAGQYLVVSLSAADEEVSTAVDALRTRYLPALASLLGASAKVENFFVTRDYAATFRAAPGARLLRLPPRTALPGLILAGSWTDTGWPATMEGAVRSGHAAAREALAYTPAAKVQSRSGDHADSGRTTPNHRPELTVLAPMALEARALRAGAPWARVRRIGVGFDRASTAAADILHDDVGGVVLAGFCAAVDERLQPGDVVLATELRTGSGTIDCPNPGVLASVLRRGGLRVWTGPIASSSRIMAGAARPRILRTGAIAVDAESGDVCRRLGGRPLPVMRIVLDDSRNDLHRPVRRARAAGAAYRALRTAGGLLEVWARALGPREVVLATPRASCAGVERAVRVVEQALDQAGSPVYVRKQIVHNSHVISDLEARGAIFVDEVDEVPPGATVIFSAHGVSPEIRARARDRGLNVIDATCPLVSKVHAEARRFRDGGYDIVLVGHSGHEEVDGTLGQAPDRTRVIASADEVDGVAVENPSRVAYLTQTTLAVDDTAEIIEALKGRFPEVVGPRSSDICYATQNRQDAVRAVAHDCDIVLVIGSKNSSNSRRLVEVARRAGARAVLIEDGTEVPAEVLAGTRRVGISAGASAPEKLVAELLDALSGLGSLTISERRVANENVHFKLPMEVRDKG